jgi:RNA polymerase sigma-70 factor, ECF subfamily
VVALFRRRTSTSIRPPAPPLPVADPLPPDRAEAFDRRAFAALYQEFFAPIYRYCYARLGSQERAEDAAHQVFVRALEAFDRYQETGRARAWLFTIAHHVVANEVARRGAIPLAEEFDLPDPAASPETLALAAFDRHALRAAIERLPADQRRAIELRIAGLTGREIAAELGRSVDAVKMLQHRAIERLRAELEGNRTGGRDGA